MSPLPRVMPMKKHPILWFIVLLIIIAIISALGPAEATLGTNARVVYLHGAWVWAALAAFIAAGVVGLIGIAIMVGTGLRPAPTTGIPVSDQNIHQWSRTLGRTGLFFWITYLPISLWAMEANWNGLFLAEPRWRMAAIFAVTGLLLQLGLSFLPVSWASVWNLIYVLALFITLQATENVMHPPSPMLDSTNAGRIQIFFGGLNILLLLAAWQVARIFRTFERANVEPSNVTQ
jgi:hypothetical protein